MGNNSEVKKLRHKIRLLQMREYIRARTLAKVRRKCLKCDGDITENLKQDFCTTCFPRHKRSCRIAYCKSCGGVFKYNHGKVRCDSCYDARTEEKMRYARDKERGVFSRKYELLAAYKAKLKSGGCTVCGYDRSVEALDFHHLKNQKTRDISKLKSISALRKEITKNPVVVLCAICHREYHAGLFDLDILECERIQPKAKWKAK